MLNNNNGKQIGIFCVLLAMFCFSLKSIFAKFAYGAGITPIPLLAWRAIISFPFFFLPLIHSFPARPTRKEVYDIIILGVLGGLLYLASSIFDFIGLTYVNPSIERSVLFTFPVFVIILSWRFNKKFPKKQFLLAFVSQIGLLTMLAPSINEPSWENTIMGVGLVFISALLWALFMLFSSHAISKIGAIRFTSAYMGVACIVIVIIALILNPNTFLVWRMGIEKTWPIVALAIICTIIPSYMTSYGIRKVGVYVTAIVSGAGPIVTLWFDQLLFGHLLLPNEIIGSIIVAISITAIALLNKSDSKNQILPDVKATHIKSGDQS